MSVRVASRQDAREGGLVASCDCARLGTRARVAGWGLLVVILLSDSELDRLVDFANSQLNDR